MKVKNSYLISSVLIIFFLILNGLIAQAQDPWIVKADNVIGRYYGETVANGSVGIVMSNTPFKI
jgi:hypothetical protein